MHHTPSGPPSSVRRTASAGRARSRTAAVLAPLVAVAAFLHRTRVLPVTLAGLVVASIVIASPLPSFDGGSSTAALTAPTEDAPAEAAPTEAAPTEDEVRELVPATDDERWTQDGAPAKKSPSDRKAKKSAERPSATAEASEEAAAESAPESSQAAETAESAEAGSRGGSASTAAASKDAPARKKPSSGGGGGGGGLEAEVLSLVNDERADAGCPAVSADPDLAAVARAHSADMRDRGYFDHKTPEGADPFDRAEDAGVSNARAENIARGQQSPESVMDAWMDSSGHRANILDCDLRTLGVGVATGSGGPWWTQLFGV